MAVEVIVLAAGHGVRMRSGMPKALHEVGGRPMLDHVLDTARQLRPARLHVVVGAGAEAIRARHASATDVCWARQPERLGTGHAVACALPAVADTATVLIHYVDAPLVRADTLAACVAASEAEGGVALLTATAPDPTGLGRIVRDGQGRVLAIVEDRDASPAERSISEVNTGTLAAPAAVLKRLVAGLSNDNAQGEYYLTDVAALASAQGVPVTARKAPSWDEVASVNDRVQLAAVERLHQRRRAEAVMRAGVTLMDPARFDLRGELTAGEGCVIDVNVVLEGRVALGDAVRIGPNCVIRDATLGDGVVVLANTVIEGAALATAAQAGPFARLRPGTVLGAGARVGNFVETKAARLGAGAKASHLAYLGDAVVGEASNIGAGAITCNYDGVDKHQTSIGARAFVGTNVTLVAPVEVGDDAYVGAGSTITRKVAAAELAVGRARQRNVQGWTPPGKRKR